MTLLLMSGLIVLEKSPILHNQLGCLKLLALMHDVFSLVLEFARLIYANSTTANIPCAYIPSFRDCKVDCKNLFKAALVAGDYINE